MLRPLAVSTALAAALWAPSASAQSHSLRPSRSPHASAPQGGGTPYGLDGGQAVGAYLNGVFPDAEPGSADTFTAQPAPGGFAFNDPMDIVCHPNGTLPGEPELFVAERAGRVWSISDTGTKELFLDVSGRCTEAGEGGLMGFAAHPDLGVRGSLGQRYVYAFYGYAPDPAALVGVPQIGFYGAYTRLSRFEVPPGSGAADPATEVVLFQLRLLNGSHRGGDLAFGPDGMLYVPMGNQFEFAAGQNMAANLHGGVLRIDVDQDPSRSHPPTRTFPLSHADEWSGQGYWIPNDNPFLDPGGARFEEYWCLGLRNPHRMDFDQGTGELWVGEVGSVLHDEINIIEAGANYGYPFREGFGPGPVGAPATFDGTLTDPVIAFERQEATAIIGGFVYRGTQHPGLFGQYLCVDHVRDRMFAVAQDPSSGFYEARPIGGFSPGGAVSLGRDPSGEILIGSLESNAPLFTLRANQAAPEPPDRLSMLGAFIDLPSLTPASGWIPYGLNAPFWSDGAVKSRWVAVPNDGAHDESGERVERALRDGPWSLPAGSVTMKHFELPIDATDPTQRRPLETRFVVFTDEGHYGVSYHWLPDGSDALLGFEARSETFDVVNASGAPAQQTWDFPGRQDCKACHGPATGGALGLRTHQLNGDILYPNGVVDNQLRAWNHAGLFERPLDEARIAELPRAVSPADTGASLADRSRAFLDANCASCHGTGAAGRATFDARFGTPLFAKDLIYGSLEDGLGAGDAHPITPQAPARSIALHRLSQVDGFAMPPIGKNVLDQVGIDLMLEWINSTPPFRHDSLGRPSERAEGADTWPRHAVIDLGSQLTVSDPAVSTVRAEAFRFYARHNGEALTPFIAKATGQGQFKVLSIGQTIKPKTYPAGPNRLPFGPRGHVRFSVQQGDVLVAGFLNASPEGLGPAPSESSGPSIPYGACDSTGAAWTSGDATSAGSPVIAVDAALIPGTKTQTYGNRAYSFSIDLVAESTNTAPVFERLNSQVAQIGDQVTWQMSAVDYEGATVKFPSASGLPGGLSIDINSGVISGTIPMNSVGEHLVTVSASDGSQIAEGTFRLTVLP